MIADSPYELAERTLPPWAGVVAGLAGAAAMLGFLSIAGGTQAYSSGEVLHLIGTTVLPQAESWSVAVGAITHFATGALFGLLYAICQQRLPLRSLIGVCVFYGFFLWVLPAFPLAFLFAEELHTMLRSWIWLFTCLIYAAVLAGVTIAYYNRQIT